MTSKIIRSLKFVQDTYNIDSLLLHNCELFGYEVDDAKQNISIIYDRDEDKIVGVIGLYSYFYKIKNNYLQVQIHDHNAKVHIDGYTHSACDIELFLIDESFKCNNGVYIITELQYELIHQHAPKALSIIDTYIGEMDHRVVRRLNNVEYNSKSVALTMPVAGDKSIDSSMRTILMSLGYLEIFTHTIVSQSVIDMPFNLTLMCNKIDGYLSHNYLRESITTSFYFEYQVYKQHSAMFEVSDVFNLSNAKKQDSINIFFCYKRYLDYKLRFSIDCVLSFYNLSARYYFSNKNQYVKYIYYVDTNKETHCIGIHTIYNDIMCYELYCDVLSNINNDMQGVIVYNDVNNFTEDNISDHYNNYACQSFLDDSSIISIKIIDIYKGKYTVRIEKSIKNRDT